MRNKLLFTGASGFLGNSVKPILQKSYDVTTIGLTDNDDYKVNLAKDVPHFTDKFDIILHAAGKAHSIPRTEEEKKDFYDVNYQGTVNLCSALETSHSIPQSIIFISTVAVYGCEFGEMITEEHPLSGDTPYAESKKMAEAFLAEWCSKHNVILGVIRPSLLAGSNAPGNLGAMVSGIKSGRYFSISGGKAKKSVLMVQDIANLIPLLAKRGGIYNVCDTVQLTFNDLEKVICEQLGKKRIISIPLWLAKCLATVGDCFGSYAPINSIKLKKITSSLTFSNEKARRELGWEPLSVIDNYQI